MYVVDTNIINWLIDGRLQLEDLPNDGDFVTTHIQHDELSKTKDPARRAELLAMFAKTTDQVVPTESAVAGVSRAGSARASDGKRYESLVTALAAKNKKKKKNMASNCHDALIAEVAIQNNWVLITADQDLADIATAHGCACRVYPAAP